VPGRCLGCFVCLAVAASCTTVYDASWSRYLECYTVQKQVQQRYETVPPAGKHLLSSLSVGVSTAWPALSLRRLASPFRLRGWCCAATAATAAAATAVRGGPSGGAAGSAAL
jgi:hypothetical protein